MVVARRNRGRARSNGPAPWWALAAWIATAPAVAAETVFMTPIEAEAGDARPAYRVVTDPERNAEYAQWLENGAAALALELYGHGLRLARQRGVIPDAEQPYHIALIPAGNFADIGFSLHTDAGVEEHASQPYIKLDPSPEAFTTTLLHETGHVVLSTLRGGTRVPARPIASIPHSTAMLSNRGTAFNEGFAIHLETLAGHLLADEALVRRDYRFTAYDFASERMRTSEYLRHVVDFRNYAQTRSRYDDVRRNMFAFAAAHREPEYLRVQLDKTRDLARLRDANQLLQSEGFHATFFFACVVRGDAEPDRSVISERLARLVAVVDAMFASTESTPETPFLLHVVQTWLRLFPDEGATIVETLNDLSHGVFVDAFAGELWRETYEAALSLDIRNFPPPGLHERRRGWTADVLRDPDVLFARVGPQITCVVPDRSVLLVAFGRPAPLAFDVNTVQEGIIRMVPEMTDAAVDRWLQERAVAPFADEQDFVTRMESTDPWLRHLEFR